LGLINPECTETRNIRNPKKNLNFNNDV